MRTFAATVAVAWLLAGVAGGVQAQIKTPADRPWMNQKLSPDERAALLERALTLPEKICLLHGIGRDIQTQYRFSTVMCRMNFK